MNGGQVAALIAAGFFAVGMVAAVYVLVRLAGLISAARRLLTDYHGQASALIERANVAVDRADQQLGRTDAITSSMDEVTANMAELSGHVSALSGLARSISAGFGTPLLRVSALAFGVRRALALRTATTTHRKAVRGASGGRPPGSALRGASGGRPPGSALRGASGGRPPGSALPRPPASGRKQQ